MNALEIVAISLCLSIAASGLLTLGCALVTNGLRVRAGVAQWVWFCALIATALLPVAGGISAVARAHGTTEPSRAIVTAGTPQDARSAGHSLAARAGGAEPLRSRGAAPAPWAPLKSALPFAVGIVCAVALAGLANVGFSLLRLRAIKRRSTPLDETLSHDLPWLSETTEGRETYLRLSYEIETPMAIGFGRPVILIPTDLANENGLNAIESLVIHEHAHLRHYDDYTNLVQRVIERLNWFNPFVWYMGRRLTLAREMSADDAVLDLGGSNSDYAQTLWRMAREMRMPTQPIVAPGAFFTRKQISARIEAIMSANRGQLAPLNPTAVVIGLTFAIVAYGLVALFTPSYEFRSADASEGSGRTIIVTVPSIPPIPPIPAVPPVPGAAGEPQPDPRAVPTIPPSALGYIQPGLLQRIKSRLQHLGGNGTQSPAPAQPSRESSLQPHCTSGCDLTGADFSGRDLSHMSFGGSDLSKVNFRGANLRDTGFEGATLDGAQFTGADLRGARFSGSSLDGTNFKGANMEGVTFSGVDLSSAHFDNAGLRTILLHGCGGCDLSGLDMRGVDLEGVNLSGTDLSNVNLTGANLSHATFSGVTFDGANLDDTDLTETTFSGCSLSDVSTKNAKMDRVTLHGSSFN